MKSSVDELHCTLDIAEENTANGSEEIAQEAAKSDKVKERLRERFRICCMVGEDALYP